MSRVLAFVGALTLTVTFSVGVRAGRQGAVEPPPRVVTSTIAPRDPAAARGVATRTVPVGTGAIAGTVTAAATGRPLSNVRLMLSGTSEVAAPSRGAAPGPVGATPAQTLSLSRTTLSDEQGRFTFDALPRGRFTLNATRDQYLSAAYGATKPTRPGTAIPLADGQHMTVAMPMIRGGVIAGTVYGQDGDPLLNTQIRTSRLAYANGVKRLVAQGYAQTDDRGMYRVTNLQPGQYFVSAVPNFSSFPNVDQIRSEAEAFATALEAARQGGRSPSMITFAVANPPGGPQPGFVGTYYPSAGSIASAQPILVAGGDEHSGIDIVALTIRASSVTGLVAGMPTAPLGVQLSLVNVDPASDGGQQGTRAQADGSFTFPNVTPGTYTLAAQVVPAPNIISAFGSGGGGQMPTVDPAERYWGRASVVVDGETMPRVVIGLQPPHSISGTVAFQGAGGGRGGLLVQLLPDPTVPMVNVGQPLQAPIAADGQFTINGVGAGSYLLRTGGGRAKSAILNGQDLFDFPLAFDGSKDVTGVEITLLTEQPSRLTGTLTESSGVAGSAYTIIVIASDRRYWTPSSRRIQTARPDLDGHFTLTGLPAGDYQLAAVTDLEQGQQFDPEFLNDLAAASVPVTITDGGQTVRDIRVNR